MEASLSKNARDVLEVVKQLDSDAAEPHPSLHQDQINERMGREPGDADTDAAVVELADAGYLEPVYEQTIQQLQGPAFFHYTY